MPYGSIRGQSEPLESFSAIESHLELVGPCSCHFESFWRHLDNFGAFQSYFEQFVVICRYLECARDIWCHFEPCGAFLAIMPF